MHDRVLFLKSLNEIIEERSKSDIVFFDLEQNKHLLAKEYYNLIWLEVLRLADKIFQDEDFFEEQFKHYENFYDYIDNIISDMIKEDTLHTKAALCYIMLSAT